MIHLEGTRGQTLLQYDFAIRAIARTYVTRVILTDCPQQLHHFTQEAIQSNDEHWVSPDKQNSSSYHIRAEDARTSDIRPGAWQGVSRTPFLTKKEKIIHSCDTA